MSETCPQLWAHPKISFLNQVSCAVLLKEGEWFEFLWQIFSVNIAIIEKKAFFSLLLMRKRHSGGQKWFLKPYFPLIRGMFVFRSGLRFSFRALEVAEPRVRKCPFIK